MRFLFLFTSLFLSLNASAVLMGNEGPHGGDEDGVLFQKYVFQAVNFAEKEKIDLGTSYDKIRESLKNAKIVFVDIPLTVILEGVQQSCVARNYADTGMIEINRARWNTISNARVREAIALHEILGLLKVETTGVYTFTANYLAAFGLSTIAVKQLDPYNVWVKCQNRAESERFDMLCFANGDLCHIRYLQFKKMTVAVSSLPKRNCSLSPASQQGTCDFESKEAPLSWEIANNRRLDALNLKVLGRYLSLNIHGLETGWSKIEMAECHILQTDKGIEVFK